MPNPSPDDEFGVNVLAIGKGGLAGDVLCCLEAFGFLARRPVDTTA